MGNNDKRDTQVNTPASNNPTSTERKDPRPGEQATAAKSEPSDRKDAAPASETPAKA